MSFGEMTRQRRAPLARPDDTLSVLQTHWLGALLITTQIPLIGYVPVWVACLGSALVVARYLLPTRKSNNAADAPPRIIPSWMLGLLALATALAIKESLGYFVGRDPCIAFLYALIGIKYLETRSARDGTLIVCLAALLIITPFFYSQSLFAAAAAIVSVIMLGATLFVLSRPMMLPPMDGGWRAPFRPTVRMLIQGIPIAVMLFLLFPRIAGPLWGVPAEQTASSGLSDRMEPGGISKLSLSDAVAFRVDFEGAIPPPWMRYWRGPVLSNYDGHRWTMAPERIAGSFVRNDDARPVIYTVTLEPHWKVWLFALDLPASPPQIASDTYANNINTDLDAMLTRDQQLRARLPVAQPLRYQQTSNLRDSYPAGNRHEVALDVGENTALPPEEALNNPRTLEFAHEMHEKHPQPAEYIKALLDWFHSEHFYYTLEPPEYMAHPIDTFLFDGRRGFCEHYASAFVVLLRAAGIPARVVTGYQGGSMNPSGDYMIVRQSDAHAWAEALVDGKWHRYDPTAAVAPSRIQLGLGGSLAVGEHIPFLARIDDTFLKSLQLSWDALNHDWRRTVIGFNFDRQRMLWRELRLTTLAAWQIAAVVVSIAGVWVVGLLGWLAWRRRRQDRARAIWDAMCKRLARAGLPRAGHEGPIAFVTRAALRWPEFAGAFAVIGDSYAALRYGPVAVHADTTLERASALWRLKRAVAMLPSPAVLRGTPIPQAA
jgi:transglutaminase-like putative cysteine protease